MDETQYQTEYFSQVAECIKYLITIGDNVKLHNKYHYSYLSLISVDGDTLTVPDRFLNSSVDELLDDYRDIDAMLKQVKEEHAYNKETVGKYKMTDSEIEAFRNECKLTPEFIEAIEYYFDWTFRPDRWKQNRAIEQRTGMLLELAGRKYDEPVDDNGPINTAGVS